MTTERTLWRAEERIQKALSTIAAEALQRPLPMTCLPPAPLTPFSYGDVVPLGFLLMALSPAAPEHPKLKDLLRDRQQGLLWAYHRDTLVTCTDSALVLQGFRDADGVAALDRFKDDSGRYSPQLCSDKAEPGVMQVTPYNRHWCQPDYATTSLVNALRFEAGLERHTATESYLVANYERRSGLYFANPYLVDWVLARSLRGIQLAAPLKRKLAAEILASRNEDWSFGRYDIPMSTALAILALTALGLGHGHLLRSQECLIDLIEPDSYCPSGTPFYSTAIVPGTRFPAGALTRMMLGTRQGQFVWAGGEVHGVSLYVDDSRMISTSLAALALSSPSANPPEAVESFQGLRHPRYSCMDHLEYIVHHGLPPYVG